MNFSDLSQKLSSFSPFSLEDTKWKDIFEREQIIKIAAGTVAVAGCARFAQECYRYGGVRNVLVAFFTGHEVFPVIDGYIPVLGNVPGFLQNSDRLFDWLTEGIIPHGGKPVVLRQPGRRVILLTDPRHVEHIWVNNFDSANRRAGDTAPAFQDMFGNGIFNSDGMQWKKHRKIASRLFSMRRLKERMFQDFNRYAQVLVRKLKEIHSQNPDKPLDIQDMFLRLTMDGFFSSLLGVNSQNVAEAPAENEFSHAFDTINHWTATRLYDRLLFWQWGKLFGSAPERSLAESRDVIRRHAQRMLNDRKGIPLDERTDLMSLFLKEKSFSDGMTEDDMVDMLINFIAAGRDTTAITMCWTLYELAKNPDKMEKVIAELNAVDELTFEAIQTFEYTERAFLEAGRMHSLVPISPKTMTRDVVLPGNDDWVLRKGDGVFLIHYAIGRAPYNWENPMTYNPDRFENGLNTFDPSKYTMFNVGNRICLGRHVAILEMKVALWYFFKNFRYTIDPDVIQNTIYEIALTLEIKGGLPINLEIL